ncbi:FCS-Like Zinc finger 17-like [Vicia villosa]|uniref:FCS-Like Zinc finger 17-like n=1 Tax=Vicia villosa TaxID=3911 RepID=UPI00273C237F|nr:FCS-Like Zinc finger 17-like [Vicia villosa]
MEVGLRLLPHIITSKNNSNILIKSALKKPNQTIPMDFCFLKTCNLCDKNLSQDKDIYMYRGDQGFCSIECRNRQIVLDEMKELEISTKRIVKSYRQCCNEARRETSLILKDIRMQRLKSKV